MTLFCLGGAVQIYENSAQFCSHNRGSIPRRGGEGLLSPRHRVQTGCGTHSASYPVGAVRSFPGAARGRGVKLTTHLRVVPGLGMSGTIRPLPKFVFMAWYLVKHSDSFTFTLTVCVPGEELK